MGENGSNHGILKTGAGEKMFLMFTRGRRALVSAREMPIKASPWKELAIVCLLFLMGSVLVALIWANVSGGR